MMPKRLPQNKIIIIILCRIIPFHDSDLSRCFQIFLCITIFLLTVTPNSPGFSCPKLDNYGIIEIHLIFWTTFLIQLYDEGV